MSGSKDFASLFAGGLTGASSGAGMAGGLGMAGVAASGPLAPWLIGGGAALGAIGSILGSRADEEDETPEEREAKRRERGLSMFRANVGRALRSRGQPSFGEMVNGPA